MYVFLLAFFVRISLFFRFAPLCINYFVCNLKLEERNVFKKDVCHTRTFSDSRCHLRLCFPLSISFLCTFLSSLGSALIYHRFPLQSRLERRSVLKRICAIPGPSRTVGFTSVYAFLLAFLSSAHFFPLQGPPLYITDFLCSPDWRDEVY